MDVINNLWDRFISGFPNIVVAIIYLIIAFIVALIAKKALWEFFTWLVLRGSSEKLALKMKRQKIN